MSSDISLWVVRFAPAGAVEDRRVTHAGVEAMMRHAQWGPAGVAEEHVIVPIHIKMLSGERYQHQAHSHIRDPYSAHP